MEPTYSDPTQQFAEELARADPVRLALVIARIAFPALQVDTYLLQLESMATLVAPRIAGATPGMERALSLIQAMRLDLGMRGNSTRYYDAANSYLNVVLERRTGLPIMLSLVLVALGQHLGLNVEGAGFPGHFMARYQDADGIWFLDPFHGAVLMPAEVAPYLMRLFGQSTISLDESYFAPVAPQAWAMRILNNLHGVFANGGELGMLAKALPLMLLLEPERQDLWQELGLVEYRRGELTRSARALRRFFFLQGHCVLSAPNSTAPPAPPVLNGNEEQLWHLLEEIEVARTRWN
jgi:regulator of sirC expression with transglutaminase-like and TPR domain